MDSDALAAAARLAEQKAMKGLAARLVDFERRLIGLENGNQIGHSSIDGGALVLGDEDGNYRGSLGTQVDGSVTLVELNGATPPTPTPPSVDVSTVGSVTVGWDGLWAGGPVPALDIARVDIYVATPDIADPLAAEVQSVGTVLTSRGGAATMSLMPGDYVAFLVTWSRSGKPSVPTAAVPFTVAPLSIAPTDGEAPSPVSLVSLSPTVGGVQVRWRPVDNADPTTYDVHAVELPSGVDDFTVADTNRVARSTGDFTVVRALTTGADLEYEQTATSTHAVASYAIDGTVGVATITTAAPHAFVPGNTIAVSKAGHVLIDISATVIETPTPTTVTYATGAGTTIATTAAPGEASALRTAVTPRRYGFKVVAWDADGFAEPSECVIGTPRKITHDDIAARSISGDMIDARAITADHLQAVMVMSGMFTTSDPALDQPRVETTAEGIFTYGDKVGPDGKKARSVEIVPGRSVFRGRLEADEVVVIEGMQISGSDTGDGGGTKFMPGADLVLSATVPAPQTPAIITGGVTQTPLPAPPEGFNAAHRQGPVYTSVSDGNGICMWTATYDATTGTLLLEQFTENGEEVLDRATFSLYGDRRYDPATLSFTGRSTNFGEFFVMLHSSAGPTLFHLAWSGPAWSEYRPDAFVHLGSMRMSDQAGAVGRGLGSALVFALPVANPTTLDGQVFAKGEVAVRQAAIATTRTAANLIASPNGCGEMGEWVSPYGTPAGVEDPYGFFGWSIVAPRRTGPPAPQIPTNHAPYANTRGSLTGWTTPNGTLTAQPIASWGTPGGPASTHYYRWLPGTGAASLFQSVKVPYRADWGPASWSMKMTGMTDKVRLRTRWLNASDDVIRTDTSALFTLDLTTHEPRMEGLVPPVGTVRMEVGIVRDPDPLGAAILFGNVHIVAGETAPAEFRDGYSFGWRFLGDVGASPSGPTYEITEVATVVDVTAGNWLGLDVEHLRTNSAHHVEAIAQWFDDEGLPLAPSTIWSTREGSGAPIVGNVSPVMSRAVQVPAEAVAARVRLVTYLSGTIHHTTQSNVRWSGVLLAEHDTEAAALAQSFGTITVTPNRTLRIPQPLNQPIAAVEMAADRYDYPAGSGSALFLTRRAPYTASAFGLAALVFDVPSGSGHATVDPIGDGWAWYPPGIPATAFGWNPDSGRFHVLRADGRATAALSHNKQSGELTFGYDWADTKTTGGTHVTTVSPRVTSQVFTRMFTRITLPPIPAFPANINHLDDPDGANVYVGRSALRERLQRQGAGAFVGTPGQNLIVDLDTLELPAGTSDAPALLQPSAVNTFADSDLFAPAVAQSQVQPVDSAYAPGAASGFLVDGFGGGYWLQVAPIGTMVQWAGASLPPGWVYCDGSSRVRADEPILFGAIGTKYGAPSSTTFRLPMRVGTDRTEVDATALVNFTSAAKARIENGFAEMSGTVSRTAGGVAGAQNALSLPSRFAPAAQSVYPAYAAGAPAGTDTAVAYTAMQPTGVLVVNYAVASTGTVWLSPQRWKVAAWTLCDDTNWIIRVA